jgi:hypothetical protein
MRVVQGQLRREHDALRELEPGTAEYDNQADRVLKATDELLEREAKINIDAQRRRASSMIVILGYCVVVAVMLVLGVVSALGVVSRWWLLAAVAACALAARTAIKEHSRPTRGHMVRRAGAVLAVPVGLLLALAAISPAVFPRVLLLVGIAGVLAVFVWAELAGGMDNAPDGVVGAEGGEP